MSSEFWDRRALALFRIGLGLYLIWYSGLCLIWGNTFFTDLGVLPMSYLTGRPEENGYGSLYLASRWWVWAYFLMSCQLLLSVGVTIGYRTTAISGPLALLVWSLNARNPYVSGLTEDWLLLLILVLGTLPVTEEFRVRESRVWGSSYSCLEGPRNLVAWLLLLALPGAWVCEQIFTQPSSGWTWVGLLSLGGLVAPARWRALRNLSVLLFAVWAVVGWSGHSLALVGVLVALAFVRSEPATETTGSAASVPLVLAVLLQAHWALYQIGTVSESFPTVIQRERAIASDSYRLFGFTTGRESALGLYRSCLLYTSPSPRDQRGSRMPSSA